MGMKTILTLLAISCLVAVSSPINRFRTKNLRTGPPGEGETHQRLENGLNIPDEFPLEDVNVLGLAENWFERIAQDLPARSKAMFLTKLEEIRGSNLEPVEELKELLKLVTKTDALDMKRMPKRLQIVFTTLDKWNDQLSDVVRSLLDDLEKDVETATAPSSQPPHTTPYTLDPRMNPNDDANDFQEKKRLFLHQLKDTLDKIFLKSENEVHEREEIQYSLAKIFYKVFQRSHWKSMPTKRKEAFFKDQSRILVNNLESISYDRDWGVDLFFLEKMLTTIRDAVSKKLDASSGQKDVAEDKNITEGVALLLKDFFKEDKIKSFKDAFKVSEQLDRFVHNKEKLEEADKGVL